MIGTTLSHYRITEKLGAGGMGEVYRAEDTNLDRQVAIKVLPDIFSGDPERLARFEREARLLASLNHPNIAAIYGLEHAEGKRFLVMELVEGETLAQRIAKGPLPVDETLDVCRQIAEGLEAAHEKGVIHRDLKPANVKITPEGKVKVLDFGLAKAFQGEIAAADASHSPTHTDQMTRPGVILGTAAYMAPEQAKGKAVDKRADVWAFGCILYECLTAKRAFEGETITETLAAVIRGEPDWNMLPAETPHGIRTALRRCLQKDASLRLRDIADAQIEILDAASGASESQQTASPKVSRWRALPWTFAAAMMIIVAVFGWRGLLVPEGPPPSTIRSIIPLPEPLAQTDLGDLLAMSPDGRYLAYVAGELPKTRIYQRRLDEMEFKSIPETEGATSIFFSRDGSRIGFFAEGRLKEVAVAGGAPIPLSETIFPMPSGGTWGIDNSIFFSRAPTLGISRYTASAGIETVIEPGPQDYALGWPQQLPEKNLLLYTLSAPNIVSFNQAKIVIGRIGDRSKNKVISGGAYARYLPTTGHIIYGYDGTLMAAPLDLERQEITGKAERVLERIWMYPTSGAVLLAVSDAGHLVYVPGGMFKGRDRLALMDRNGGEILIDLPGAETESHTLTSPAVSPDGSRIAVCAHKATDDIHIYDSSSITFPRVTFDGGDERAPVWNPDKAHLAYGSEFGERAQMYMKAADGSTDTKPLFPSEYYRYPCSFSSDGKTLAFMEKNPKTGWDIWTGSVGGEEQPQPFLQTRWDESFPEFSPDGQWIAYQSNDSGQMQIYVAKYPDKSIKKQISQGGGIEPHWASFGTELFYLSNLRLMVATISFGPASETHTTKLLFPIDPSLRIFDMPPLRNYAVWPDGKKIVFIKPAKQEPITRFVLVSNWFEELKRLVPTGK